MYLTAPKANTSLPAVILLLLALAAALAPAAAEAALASYIKSIEKVTITIASNSATGSANLSLNQTTANCVPLVTGKKTGANGYEDQHHRYGVRVYFESGPKVTAERGYIDNSQTIYLAVTVVEFKSADVRVQHNTYTIASTGTSA